MELRLVVGADGLPERELAIEVQPGHTVRELLAALAAQLELEPAGEELVLYCPRLRGVLAAAGEVRATGLRTGDRVVLVDPRRPLPGDAGAAATPRRPFSAGTPPPAADPPVELVVVGGPSAGRRVPLPTGTHRVGSHPYSEIMIGDAALSKIHALVTVDRFGRVAVADAGSEGGVFLAGRRIAGDTAVEPGQVVAAGRTLLAFQARDRRAVEAPVPDESGRIAFNRPPRLARPEPKAAFKLEAPPQMEGGGRLPLGSALVPLGMGVGMYLVMHQLSYLLFTLLSPVMAVFSFVETRIGGRRGYRRRLAAWRERLREVDHEMEAARDAEVAYREASSPNVAALAEWARTLDPRLWERRPDGPDWLRLRVGWWDGPSSAGLELGQGGRDELRAEAEQVAARHRTVHASPMLVSLKDAGVLGIAGELQPSAALARSLGLQLATLHSPEDLVLAGAIPAGQRDDWSWLGWLPHLTSDSSPVAGPLLVTDRTAARALIDRVLALVAQRRAVMAAYHGAAAERIGPSVVAFLHEDAELPRGAVSQLLQQGPQVGVHAIWLGHSDQALPGECGAVVVLLPGVGTQVLTLPATGQSFTGGGPDGVPPDIALEVGRALAPVHDVSSRESQAGVPRRVNLIDQLGLREHPENRILQCWIRDRSAPDERLLSATWGMAAGGEPFRVSLREDGPHALVGGMTGSGKSELLQSLVASLAVSHSPRSLNFLLVDYKGGAAFKDCVDLPHTVGFVTDLDGHLVSRALTSLRAELRRREEVLRESGAKDLLDLERRQPDHTPASLLIVVDEFAALTAELPEFVDGMVDVAQRGRSLGIHLLLATQRPQGAISDKIRANMNLRVSLRFSDESESVDIIGTRDAARPGLPPGRAFARTGPGDVTEFQASYVGGQAAASVGPAPISVRGVGFGGVAPAGPERAASQPEGESDLMRLVRVIGDVNRRLGLPPPPRPWLPTLPEVLRLDELGPAGPGRARVALVDEPAGQRQVPLDLGLEDGSLLVHGTGGSGKTTLLRTLAVSMARSLPPTELHVYGLDFATRGLKSLETLPHCGGVVVGDEVDRATRLLRMLRADLDRRKGLLAATGAATLGEHLASGPAERLPYVLLLLDGYAGFVSVFEGIDLGAHVDTLRTLVAEGRSVGIVFAISADRHAGHLAALSASMGRRVILRMATEDEYALLGLPRTAYAGANLPPGRGFTEKGLELHCAIVGADPRGSFQAAAVAQLGADLHERHGAAAVPPVRLLPSEVARTSLPAPQSPMEAVVGIEDRGLQPVRVDLADGHFLVAGPRRSGRTTALATFAASLAAAPEGPSLHLLAPRRQSPLAGLDVWTSVALGPEACGDATVALAAATRERPDDATWAVVVIDDGEELADGTLPDLDWIAQRGRERGLRILVGVETQAAQRAFAAWLMQVQRERQGILLDPDTALDGTLVGGVQLPRRSGGRWPAGRGYLVRRGMVELVQVAGD